MMPDLDHLTDARTLAAHYGVAVGTIYRWVSEDQLPVYGPRNARRYRLGDIQDACDRRHPTTITARPT